MKILRQLAVFAASAFFIIGCTKSTLTRINVEESLPHTRVEGVGVVNILPLTLSHMKLDMTSTEDYESEEFDYTTEIKFRSLLFRITESSTDYDRDTLEDGVDDNFDFLSSLELFIKATIDGDVKQVRIAFLDPEDSQIYSGASEIKLSIEDVDILAYVEAKGGYEVIVNATGHVPPDDVIFDGKAVYRVGIGFD